jgi:hypothetical protein
MAIKVATAKEKNQVVVIGITVQASIKESSWEYLVGTEITGARGLHCRREFRKIWREENLFHRASPKNWMVDFWGDCLTTTDMSGSRREQT